MQQKYFQIRFVVAPFHAWYETFLEKYFGEASHNCRLAQFFSKESAVVFGTFRTEQLVEIVAFYGSSKQLIFCMPFLIDHE